MKCPSYMDLWDKFGPGHMRVDLKNDIKPTELNEGLSNTVVKVNFASWQNPVADKQNILDSNMEGIDSEDMDSIESYGDWQSMIETEVSKNGYTVSKSQIQWLKDVEDYAKMVLETDIKPPEMVYITNWHRMLTMRKLKKGGNNFAMYTLWRMPRSDLGANYARR